MKRADVLDEVKRCVCGQREQDYGTPEDNFSAIGYFWAVYLRTAHPELSKVLPLNGISAKDVSVMMSLLKVARIATGSSADSFVDLAGYAALAGEIITHKKKNARKRRTDVLCVMRLSRRAVKSVPPVNRQTPVVNAVALFTLRA